MSDDADGVDGAQPGATPRSGKTGLLIIRAWVEEGSSEPLRANVRATTDVGTGIERTVTLTRAEEVGATVQEWLAEILGAQHAVEPAG
ncbi:MAG TPA: hypothetical protein VFK43_21860 [Acidimicrobiales bacterium]|nr:hypothetical protein [Acidimicrobiales bacterium]